MGLATQRLTPPLIAIACLLLAPAARGAVPPVGAPPSWPSSPAHALPADALAYVEFRQPQRALDTLAGLELWAAVEELGVAAAELEGVPSDTARTVTTLMEEWTTNSQLRRDLIAVGGEQMIAALLQPRPGDGPPFILLAGRGDGTHDPVTALFRLCRELHHPPDQGLALEGPRTSFRIVTGRSGTLMTGAQASDWLVVGPADRGAAVTALARGLAGWDRAQAASSLAASATFGRVMARLPRLVQIRGFVNTAAMADLLDRTAPPGGQLQRVASFLLRRSSGVGFARHVEVGCLRTWIECELRQPGDEDALSRLIAGLTPIRRPLTGRLPAHSLATWELSAPPERLLAFLSSALAAGAPDLHRKLVTLIDALTADTGLRPSLDLLPCLGHGVAVALLPSDTAAGGQPLPRPVMLVGVADEGCVRQFLTDFCRWHAGAVASLTQGLASAMIVSEEYNGVELTGLQIEGVLPVALPSPTFAVVDGVLVVSPVRSAAREAVSSLLDPPSTNSPVDVRCGRFHADLADAVEVFEVDLPGVVDQWRRADAMVPGPESPARRLARAMARVVDSLGSASGHTTMSGEGRLSAYLELHPREMQTATVRFSDRGATPPQPWRHR